MTIDIAEARPAPRCDRCQTPMQEGATSLRVDVGARVYGPYPTRALLCPHCGNYWIGADALQQIERRAAREALESMTGPYGLALRYARKALGLTQAALADRLDMTNSHVSRMETGAEPVPLVTRLAVQRLLEIES